MSNWNDSIPTIYSGSVPDADDWSKILTLLTSLTDAWTDYSASLAWTAASANPAIGNGTLTAYYKRYGKTVLYGGNINMGSTTTFGTGTWFVSLPFTALDAGNYTGGALTYDSSAAAARTTASCTPASTTTLQFFGINGVVSPTVPFTWASGDILRWLIVYQAA